MTRYIADLTDFNNTLNNQPDDKLLVVCFTASWCGPCKRIMAPVCEKVAECNPNVTIVKVDVDDCEEVASLNDITISGAYSPTLVVANGSDTGNGLFATGAYSLSNVSDPVAGNLRHKQLTS